MFGKSGALMQSGVITVAPFFPKLLPEFMCIYYNWTNWTLSHHFIFEVSVAIKVIPVYIHVYGVFSACQNLV